MTKQEFETLTGMMVDETTFSHAEDIYLNAGSLSKDEVCKEIKEWPWMLESPVVKELAKTAQEYTVLASKRLVDIEKLKAALLDAAILAADDAVWQGARELIGAATVINYKLTNEVELNTEDIAYIAENLK